MSFDEQLAYISRDLGKAEQANGHWLNRFRSEVDFAKAFTEVFPDKKESWEGLILKACKQVSIAISAGGTVDFQKVVTDAEKVLGPIGKEAKKYTIHCCGHAHIDMNWMWPWHETVNIIHDTFATINQLMDEFPEFHFGQSQASVYIAMEEYCPEIFQMIRNRIKEGRWEVTASTWVEGDKNIVSGESLCRHLLYTRAYMREKFGLKPEDVKIDWSPDTFGHTWTVPSIVTKGGVTRYFHTRTGPGPWLYKWRSPDGSELLVFNDKDGYNGPIHAGQALMMVNFVKETGLKDFLSMYGVGDHGGGPTRQDLRTAQDIQKWPIFPTYKLSTTDAFFSAVERSDLSRLPVIDRDLNFIFEGCYTSQSNIKRANRVSEIVLPEAETAALIGGAVGEMSYPNDLITRAWRWTLFNHFHDILPGSGVKATYDYAQGLFQEILATTYSINTRALRKLAGRVDTYSLVAKESLLGSGKGDGLGAGAGDPGIGGRVTAYNMGADYSEPILVYNPKPWKRSEVVLAKIWNKEVADDRVVVRDSAGNEHKGQVVARGNYWAHNYATIAFKADVPALGYKIYAVDSSASPVAGEGAAVSSMISSIYGVQYPNLGADHFLENEYLKVEIDFSSGAVKSILEKETGFNYVPEGCLFGLLEYYHETPHGMSAWIIGQTPDVQKLDSGAHMEITQRGPNRVAVKSTRKFRDSNITLEIGLNAGSRMVDFKLNTYWVERGTPQTGIPMLRAAFPVNTPGGIPTYEIALQP